jgi:hypothetical protein
MSSPPPRARPGGHPATAAGIMLSALHTAGDPKWRTYVRKAARGCDTLPELAAELGISRSTLANWLRADPDLKADLGYRPGAPVTTGDYVGWRTRRRKPA